MSPESTTNQSPSEHGSGQAPTHTCPPEATLHRICIQCNNVFCVTPEHYDAKHCPTCRKE